MIGEPAETERGEEMTAIARLSSSLGGTGIVGAIVIAATATFAPAGVTVHVPDEARTFATASPPPATCVEAHATVSRPHAVAMVARLAVTGLEAGQRVRIGSGPVSACYELFDWVTADEVGALTWQAVLEPMSMSSSPRVLVVADPTGGRLVVSNPISADGPFHNDEISDPTL